MRSTAGHPQGDHDRLVYRFGAFVLDASRQELYQGETLVALEPKVYDVLHYLVRHRDRQVSREELLEQLWPDTYVDSSVVARSVN